MIYEPAKISNITPVPDHANDLVQIQALITERIEGIKKIETGMKDERKMISGLKTEIKILQRAGKKLLGIIAPNKPVIEKTE